MPGDWIGARERGGPIGAVGTIARGAMLGVVDAFCSDAERVLEFALRMRV